MSPVLLHLLRSEANISVLVSDNVLITSEQEFDNYAEWDLRDIDFVEDDSDILHGKCHIFVPSLKTLSGACAAFHGVSFSTHF